MAEGPRRSPQTIVDGEAWGFVLERDGIERVLIVAISRQALKLGAPDRLHAKTREAIATDGLSEVRRAAQLDDPPACLVLGRSGYLTPPPGLVRLARL